MLNYRQFISNSVDKSPQIYGNVPDSYANFCEISVYHGQQFMSGEKIANSLNFIIQKEEERKE